MLTKVLMKLVIFVFLCVSLLATNTKAASVQCTFCKQVMSTVRSQLGGTFNEIVMERFIKSTCDTLLLTQWCSTYLYPYFPEIFNAIADNRTDSIVCNRINLCQTKIVAVTGDILLGKGEKLSRIVPTSGGGYQKFDIWTISHSQLPTATIAGLACSPDYCATLLRVTVLGYIRYATARITSYSQYSDNPHLLTDSGTWYGPFYDASTDEFWLAYGTPMNMTFGIYNPADGSFNMKINTRLYIPETTGTIFSGSVLNRYLYFTISGDYHVFVLDLALHLYLGNLTLPVRPTNNLVLAHNPVTQILYGYNIGTAGVYRFDSPTQFTQVASYDFAGVGIVPGATIDPIDNSMWIVLWGKYQWLKIDLTKTSQNVQVFTNAVDGYLDFNPYKIDRVDE